MWRLARRVDSCFVLLGSTSMLAWSVLAFYGSDVVLPALCSAASPWRLPLSAVFNLAFVFNAPAQLASGWALMVVAMMSPLVISPLRHVRNRSFASRRERATLVFVVGYAAMWIAAIVVLQAIALVARWAVPEPLIGLGLAGLAAIVWQVSPAKQWCLNRCHRQPHLAAFGAAADRDAFNFGLRIGAACVGACWALMLLTFFAGHAHVLAMMAVTLFVFAERLESPAPLRWRWRGFGKAMRIVAAQTRVQMAPRLI